MAAQETTGGIASAGAKGFRGGARARAERPARKGLIGRKVGMTQVFDADGTVVPVTVIEAGPCKVLRLRSLERDGYSALQVGFLDKPRRLASRSVRGQVADLESKRSQRKAEAGVV